MNKKRVIILIFILILISVIVGLIVSSNRRLEFRIHDQDGIYFEYDNTWRLSRNENNIRLSNIGNNAVIKIIIDEKLPILNNLSTHEVANGVSYQIIGDASSYQLVYQGIEANLNSSYNLFSYLYIDNDNTYQIYILVGITDNHVFSLVYQNENEAFDLLLGNFESIVQSFYIQGTD
ncbi:MAG: hypothetical protein FWC79_07635 [Oscillospiraceae bacterium]|nr:hypothetical protein [Oscillospiraceae bacterium]